MVQDPYKVLGIQPGASQDEIKSAYRRMAKQYHPDLHPNDPQAALKMNEINEAHDMLMNPEKYRTRQAYQQQSDPSSGSQAYTRTNTTYSYNGSNGWNSEFDNFEDLFRAFGFQSYYGQTTRTAPVVQEGDSAEIRRAIQQLSQGWSSDAMQTLTMIPGAQRNDRWYYLYAVASNAAGNRERAIDYIKRAIELNPGNQVYRQLLQQYAQNEQPFTYTYRSYGNTSGQRSTYQPVFSITRIILTFMIIQFVFWILQILMFGVRMPY